MIAPPPSVWDDAENDRTDEPSGCLIILVATSLILAAVISIAGLIWIAVLFGQAVLG